MASVGDAASPATCQGMTVEHLSAESENQNLLSITLGYAVFGSLWSALSDLLLLRAVGIGGGPLWLVLTSDLSFVLASATLLHLVLRRGFGRDSLTTQAPAQEPRHRLGMYLFAILFSATMVIANERVGELIGQRSILLLSVFPIVFSAYQGGFGPGLAATLVSAFLLDFLTPLPTVMGTLQSSLGLRQLLLLTTGIVISALMGRLHGATRRSKQALAELSAASAQLAALNQDLERRVTDRTAALTAANEELDSFAYAVSHDLRVPLRTMTGMVQVLKEDHAQALTDEARHCLAEIDRAGERMAGLIGGLLALSRDASQPLHDAFVAELARNDPGRQVQIDVEPGITTRGDSRLLTSALQNLLGNAWKYTSKTPEARIWVRSERRDGQCWLSIEDNGPGFGPEQAASLFRPFHRAHTAEQFAGLGIGLATVRRVVKRHGGSIECEGRPGAGATFRFTLPTLTSRTVATDP